ncbi:MAG: PaaI family thioesterase [Bryobacteraceae bacterium]|nr:PaaI family thioesterase [Bryobacteraceae bacterium]
MPTVEDLNKRRSGLPELLGFEVTAAEPGRLEARMPIRPQLLAPNGYLHAASVIALADSSCGFGTFFDLPPTASGFTTIELKSNHIGTALEGLLLCEARRAHKGRTTQVWDAEVRVQESGKTIALFRCTQIILYKANE